MKLEYARQNHIGRITLANPPYNTLTHPVFADAEELSRFLTDPALRAVIVTGRGRHFCGGADLEALRAQLSAPDALAESMARGKELLEIITFATVPVLALIRGSCLGAGLEIALACHFRFASESAMLGFPETGHGLIPGFGASAFAQTVAPRQAVIELILSGRMIRAPEAASLRLVDRAAPTRDLEPQAIAFLESLTEKRSPSLIRAVMTSIHNGRRLPLEQALRRETELFLKVARGDE